jgi:hypothetical protein
MTTTVYGFVKGKLLVTTVTKDDYLTGMIRTRVSIMKDLPSKTKTDLARESALRHRRQGRLAELEEEVGGTAVALPLTSCFHLLGGSICDPPHHHLSRPV